MEGRKGKNQGSGKRITSRNKQEGRIESGGKEGHEKKKIRKNDGGKKER